MRVSDLDILIIPGLGGSGPDHWQSRWEQKLSTARRVEQQDWLNPVHEAWVTNILREIEASSRPVALVAHSLGALAAASAARASGDKIKAAFMVAPPDLFAPQSPFELDPAFATAARAKLTAPGVLIASRNDPFSSFAASQRLAENWALELADAGESGHINADSGHGPWPEGLMRLAGLLAKI